MDAGCGGTDVQPNCDPDQAPPLSQDIMCIMCPRSIRRMEALRTPETRPAWPKLRLTQKSQKISKKMPAKQIKLYRVRATVTFKF